ncbi:quinone oxidoreductase family protein [Rothia endophytica]|uniref:quinone oxidoreductase family protein n=1 Tax=Rothia endophytica TaxID=1324766 RepID=UPI001F4789A7|nr:quinone oxidoreductase [Rothia endophytica]
MTDTTMTAVHLEATGAPDVLVAAQLPLPTPSPTQVLVKTAAVGVNFIETYQRAGVYPVQLPFVPGTEAAGEVVAVGSEVTHFSVGNRLATANATATYAEYFLVDQELAVPVPESISWEDAAALPLQGMTAHYLINSTFRVEPGHNVLIHAGAGGVGGIAIQLLKARGATVFTTVSSDEKAEIAAAHGADHVLRYEGFAENVKDLTDGAGLDVVYDGVGKDTFEKSLTVLKTRGMAALFGGASGQVAPFDLQKLNELGSLFVTRPTLAHYSQDRQEISWRMGELFDAIETGDLQLTVDQTFPLEQAAEAHTYLEARKTRGKVLLLP